MNFFSKSDPHLVASIYISINKNSAKRKAIYIICVYSVVQYLLIKRHINTLYSSVHIIQYSTDKEISRETAKTISRNFIKNIKTCLCLVQQELIQLKY